MTTCPKVKALMTVLDEDEGDDISLTGISSCVCVCVGTHTEPRGSEREEEREGTRASERVSEREELEEKQEGSRKQ